ncbi:hypothetical protein [Mangrovimonas aestuarii]|uniref:hypothetical protein n=1 Tax=Mangrovimonas aestuarii TaxID=3018443 RepID=UPI0023782503|nr:hypothetical protein [Mangrovimonas aestuarii]
MKKKLEAELTSIAHRILKLSGKEDVDKMYEEVRALYEKITVLKFAKDHFDEDLPTIGSDTSFFSMLDKAFNNDISDNIEIEDKVYVNMDDNDEDDIMEPVMEKIKDIVAQMPQETQQIDDLFERVTGNSPYEKNDFEDISADYDNMPVFEPISKSEKLSNEKKSLNDKLKIGGLHIGLNDKIAFIKHLFDGNNGEYERVISQINTTSSLEEAQNLIQAMVKPEYDWSDKEDYEARLMEIIESRFE